MPRRGNGSTPPNSHAEFSPFEKSATAERRSSSSERRRATDCDPAVERGPGNAKKSLLARTMRFSGAISGVSDGRGIKLVWGR